MLAAEVAEQVKEAFRLLGELGAVGWSVAILPRKLGFPYSAPGDTRRLLVRLERDGILIEAKCDRASDVAEKLAAVARLIV